nr:MAG TPA: hypothetical protein [Crassvirales sp.]
MLNKLIVIQIYELFIRNRIFYNILFFDLS